MSGIGVGAERRRFVIAGNVQGAGFLVWVRNVAHSLELTGSASLMGDGRCEAVVQGNRQLVKQFGIACKRGPGAIALEIVEQQSQPLDPKLTAFVLHH
ncbi:MAG: acylphosphatase [Tepidiformaceae bacterium]